jgi:hypothetical protein
MDQAVERLPTNHEALSSNLMPQKKKENKQKTIKTRRKI